MLDILAGDDDGCKTLLRKPQKMPPFGDSLFGAAQPETAKKRSGAQAWYLPGAPFKVPFRFSRSFCIPGETSFNATLGMECGAHASGLVRSHSWSSSICWCNGLQGRVRARRKMLVPSPCHVAVGSRVLRDKVDGGSEVQMPHPRIRRRSGVWKLLWPRSGPRGVVSQEIGLALKRVRVQATAHVVCPEARMAAGREKVARLEQAVA